VSIILMIAIVAVYGIILAEVLGAVISVSRPAKWEAIRMPSLSEVVTEDRRDQELPFVGLDRRLAQPASIEEKSRAA